MSLLSKTDLEQLNRDKKIFGDGFSENLIQPASVDITIGQILVPPYGDDPKSSVTTFDDFFSLPVGSTALVVSKYPLHLTDEIGGFVFPKNGDFALKGVMFTNFGHIDPGYKGHLSFTVINMGRMNFPLRCGTPIAGVVLFKLSSPTQPYQSRHDGVAITTHAKALPRDFLDIEERIRSTVKNQANIEWQTREKGNLLIATASGLLAVVVALAALIGPVSYYTAEKLTGTAVEIQKLRHEIEQIRRPPNQP